MRRAAIVVVLALALPAVPAAWGSISAPKTVRLGHRVVVWVSGPTATEVANGAEANVVLQPAKYRGSSRAGAVPKATALIVGSRLELSFSWPRSDNTCVGTRCVPTPWHVGESVDIE